MLCAVCWVLFPVLGLLSALYLWGRWYEGYYERHGIKSVPSKYIPVFEFIILAILRKIHVMTPVIQTYRAFPEEKYVGFTMAQGRMIMLRDLELIKQLAIKDFDHFQDHINFFDASMDPLFGNSLIALKGEKWRDMRATLSPAFTSSKMRSMFSLVVDCAQQTADYYLQQLDNMQQQDSKAEYEVEMKDAFSRYTTDVVASVAFGCTVDSLAERNNEFYAMGKRLFQFADGSTTKLTIFVILPKLAKLLGISLISQEVNNFFRRMVGDTMKTREERGIHRPDMIQLLMEAKKGSLQHEGTAPDKADAGFATVEESHIGKGTSKREWTEDEIVGQAFIFFFAGFDTASSGLSFMAHELAVNPEVQVKLQQEIDEVMEECKGKVDYGVLQKMKYMDMVVTETLRMWPPAMQLDRICVKPYTLPPPNDASNRTYKIKAGDGILIPVYGIHHDPQYYPEPQRFDPERFSDDNKDNINPVSYLPFGVGPRNCIGSRFALMQLKAVMFHMLAKFDFTVIAKTQIPLQLKKGPNGNTETETGTWIGLKKRTSSQSK